MVLGGWECRRFGGGGESVDGLGGWECSGFGGGGVGV